MSKRGFMLRGVRVRMPDPHRRWMREARILRYLRERQARGDDPPTYTELARAIGLRSGRVALWYVRSLAERGLVEYDPGLPRTVRVPEAPQ